MRRIVSAALAGLLAATPVSLFVAAALLSRQPLSDRLALTGGILIFGLIVIVAAVLAAFGSSRDD
jgi:hypothetical protein